MTVAERSRRYRDSRRKAGAAEMDALRDRIAALEAEVATLRAAPPPGAPLTASDRASTVVAAIAKEQCRWSRLHWPRLLGESDERAWEQLPSLVLWLWGKVPQSARSLAIQEFSHACGWVEAGAGGAVALTAAKTPFLVDDTVAETGLPELPAGDNMLDSPARFFESLPRGKPAMVMTMERLKEFVRRRHALREEAERAVEKQRLRRTQPESGE